MAAAYQDSEASSSKKIDYKSEIQPKEKKKVQEEVKVNNNTQFQVTKQN